MNTKKDRTFELSLSSPDKTNEGLSMSETSERVKLNDQELLDLKRFAKELQRFAVNHNTHKNVVIGLTEIVLRIDAILEARYEESIL